MAKIHIHYLMPHGIGDVIMTIPVLKEIAKRKSVEFSITVKSKTEAEVIRALCPEQSINFIYFRDIPSEYRSVKSLYILIKRIRSFSPDIILTQFGVDAPKSSIISFLAGSKIRVGWKGLFSFLNTITLIPSGLHKIEENLKVLQILNIDPGKDAVKYPLYAAQVNKINNTNLKNIISSDSLKIVVGPGSQELDKHKRWPTKNYGVLVNKILSTYKNSTVLLVGTREESILCEEILKHSQEKHRIINLAGMTSIIELLVLLSKVDLTITHCNGISHLACSANRPTIVLYGPTNYKITGPRSDFFIPISLELDCSPCFSKDYVTGCGNPICMEQIKVEEVYLKIRDLL